MDTVTTTKCGRPYIYSFSMISFSQLLRKQRIFSGKKELWIQMFVYMYKTEKKKLNIIPYI